MMIKLKTALRILCLLWTWTSMGADIHQLGIQITEKEPSLPLNARLAHHVASKTPYDPALVTQAIFERHFWEEMHSRAKEEAIDLQANGYWKSQFAVAQVRMADLAGAEGVDIHDLKVNYERLIQTREGEPLVYNAEHTSIMSALFDNKSQCYSGTTLLNLLARSNISDYQDQNYVYIYQSGHVLFGYLKKEGHPTQDGGWHLYGVESTLAGKAKIHFGPVQKLKGVRVVDAELAAIIDAISPWIANPQEVIANALRATAHLYDIPL
jgi:hypothetical protein